MLDDRQCRRCRSIFIPTEIARIYRIDGILHVESLALRDDEEGKVMHCVVRAVTLDEQVQLCKACRRR